MTVSIWLKYVLKDTKYLNARFKIAQVGDVRMDLALFEVFQI